MLPPFLGVTPPTILVPYAIACAYARVSRTHSVAWSVRAAAVSRALHSRRCVRACSEWNVPFLPVKPWHITWAAQRVRYALEQRQAPPTDVGRAPPRLCVFVDEHRGRAVGAHTLACALRGGGARGPLSRSARRRRCARRAHAPATLARPPAARPPAAAPTAETWPPPLLQPATRERRVRRAWPAHFAGTKMCAAASCEKTARPSGARCGAAAGWGGRLQRALHLGPMRARRRAAALRGRLPEGRAC
jgi:hypothetical protein